MQTKKHYLILAVVTGILYAPALGQIEPPETEYKSLLIGRANPALTGIDNLNVTIIHPDGEPNTFKWEKLKDQITKKLNDAGITVFSPKPGVMYKLPVLPELKIRVCLLELEQTRQYVFHIQSLLAKSIYVQVKPMMRQKADVWKTEPVMQITSIQNTPASVTNIVLEHADVFINAWRAANPKGVQTVVPNAIGLQPARQIQAPTEQVPAENFYVASKNSKVFHRPDCRWAKRIAPKNLVRYKTREEAVNDGKRPCKICKP
jgi:hypothetical protein